MSTRRKALAKGSSTRTRVLGACRELFNERGPGQVTTAEISAAVGIAEGNLYYYFQRKEQIVEALFEAYAEAMTRVAVSYVSCGDGPSGSGGYLKAWFNLMWEWRFFYRDGATVLNLAPALRPRLKALSDDAQDHVRGALEAMVAADLIRATPEQIGSLIVNAWIVSTYWIDYLRTIRGVTDLNRQHIAWGAAQMQSLFAPFLTPAGLKLVDLRF